MIEITRDEWSDRSVRMILTPSNYAQKSLFYIQEIGFFEATKNYYVQRKNLSSFLILQTLKGNGILKYDGKEYSLSRGDVFFIDCRKEHFYYIVGDKPWIFNWVHFNGLSSTEYYDSYIRYNSSPIIEMEVSELSEIFTSLLSINKVKQSTNEILSSLKITEMITLLILCCQAVYSDMSPSNDFIDKAVWYIEKHLQDKITLDEISKQFNMNKYSFHKTFRRYTNIPFNEFIILHRVNRAKELLRSSDMSVREIGETVGIYNTSHFINLFKQREGMSPLNYKHRWD